MSGTGGPSPAEHHLGDRLAALVDGELGHDARERVLAHLATCGKCKAEADDQRQLKNVFAETAPPGPSEGLLARLQGLPGGDADGYGRRLGRGGLGGGAFGGDLAAGGDFEARGGSIRYAPSGAHAIGAVPRQPRSRGFRIHEAERSAPQRRRFAAAAAGAVSLAAFALGGALPLEAAVDTPGGRTDGTGSQTTPLSATPGLYGRPGPGQGAPMSATGTPWSRTLPVAGITAEPAPSSLGLTGPSAPAAARPAPPLPVRPSDGRSALTVLSGQSLPYLAPAVASPPPGARAEGPPSPSADAGRPLAGAFGPPAPASREALTAHRPAPR
ncbi:zf-HC2 domain-containing protein [Streptomyces albofaciens JCM 4342]|uniref:zf-HC2 domain-containing protein n=1 Tax=Streptomyces albofaciens TaxID=66866 RepID=UPI0012390B1F|nr:zf-HC2 domain-containing protein [Streptomyces albofaciens]KAA6214169.1 zf-HC2 domain-containing protein [Streptomyces albofaciens JCM 4342]